MAGLLSPHYDHMGVIPVIRAEFERIGMHANLNNIEIMQKTVTFSYEREYIAIIEFTCEENEYKYLKHLLYKVDKKPIITDSMFTYGGNNGFAYDIPNYKIQYDCSIHLELSGRNINQFVNSFREAAKPIFEVIESRRFDEEVNKMLTDDEYNS